MLLFFDTETTGVVNPRLPEDHHDQPRLVQLAAMLVDSRGATMGQMCAIVRPQGFTIPERVTAIHGITQDRALQYGADIRSVLSMFGSFCRLASVAVGHNIAFDVTVMRGEFKRAGIKDPLVPLNRYCTMRVAAPIVGARDGRGRIKNPTLAEMHRFFHGEEIDGAHDAWIDTTICRRCFDELQRRVRARDEEQLDVFRGMAQRKGEHPELDALLE